MGPGPRGPKRPGPRGESPRVLGQGSEFGLEGPLYIGVYAPYTHVDGHRLVASLRPTA